MLMMLFTINYNAYVFIWSNLIYFGTNHTQQLEITTLRLFICVQYYCNKKNIFLVNEKERKKKRQQQTNITKIIFCLPHRQFSYFAVIFFFPKKNKYPFYFMSYTRHHLQFLLYVALLIQIYKIEQKKKIKHMVKVFHDPVLVLYHSTNEPLVYVQ